MRRAGLTVLVAGLLLAGCTGGEPEAAPYVFDSEGDVPVDCLAHQAQPPGEEYTGDGGSGLRDTLVVLRYYVQNQDKPYCDGAGPTDADRAWAQFYLDRTSNREPVAFILDAP